MDDLRMVCVACRGAGWLPHFNWAQCVRCKGTGTEPIIKSWDEWRKAMIAGYYVLKRQKRKLRYRGCKPLVF